METTTETKPTRRFSWSALKYFVSTLRANSVADLWLITAAIWAVTLGINIAVENWSAASGAAFAIFMCIIYRRELKTNENRKYES